MAGGSDSRKIVVAALIANFAIAVLKFLAFLVTGSPSMLSETYHSISDTGNQVLLLVGLQFAKRAPTRQHPFGWGKSEFFYGLLVAVLLFGIAGWESVREGLHVLQGAGIGWLGGADAAPGIAASSSHGAGVAATEATILGYSVPGTWISYAVLAGAFAFEFYAFDKARRGMRAIQERGRYASLWETFRKTKNASILTAFTEDLLALAGLTVAAAGLAASDLTGNPAYDATGAVVIGLLLMGFALVLAWEHKRLIVGESMDPWQEDSLAGILRAPDEVLDVGNLRTVYFGTRSILLAADLRLDPACDAGDADALVGRLEARVQESFPGIRFVYLETDADKDAATDDDRPPASPR